jgi:methyl-galactoside transport system ATP-binding protein
VSTNGFRLVMQHVSKGFPGVQALDDVTLEVRPGTVHALMGENGAGKSTLMKCLFGLYAPDQGAIFLEGKPVQITEPKVALAHGISMIHQELHPIPHRSVMENIWLGRFPLRRIAGLPFVDHKAMYEATASLFQDLGMSIDPADRLGNLSVSKIQSVEIAKAVSYNAKVIVMDEPTSSLTENEVEHLFRIIRDLRARGVSIIYISHKMDEILHISDEVTIMRDGRKVGTWPAAGLTEDLIIRNMVGRDLTHRFPEKHNVPGEVVLRVSDLTSPLARSFRNVSFDLRKGEILGIGGLVGAQRTELVEALFGLRAIHAGRVELRGAPVRIDSPADAKALGMALLTEDRRGSGIFPSLSVLENSLIANLRRYVRALLLDDRTRRQAAAQMVERLRVKTPSLSTLIRDLSGGNQQKVLFGRWLLTEPDILLLDEPTRGIDVGAKYEIYTIIEELACQGKSIIMISSEMPELLGMSDRIMVMCEGRVSGFLEGKRASQEEIMRLAAQFM